MAFGCGAWPDETELDQTLDPSATVAGLTCDDPGAVLAPSGNGNERSRRPGGLTQDRGGGELLVARVRCKIPEGRQTPQLPFEHTDVVIQVSGFVARAKVVQTFANPDAEPLEANYVFPLPEDAAVDTMTMRIGERVVRAEIARREEAHQLYEEAVQRGQRTALLEQERDNIFTQSVANIMPGDRIEIELQYVQVLPYKEGAYEVVFPLVVGPRVVPGAPIGRSGSGWALDTDRVADASRITPPVLAPTERSGHDVTCHPPRRRATDPGPSLYLPHARRLGDRPARSLSRAVAGRPAAQQGLRAALRGGRRGASSGALAPLRRSRWILLVGGPA